MRPAVSLLVLILAVAAAAGVRRKLGSGVVGRREAYGRPLSDWAGLTVLALGAGVAAFAAGVDWLAWVLLYATLLGSFVVLRRVRFRR